MEIIKSSAEISDLFSKGRRLHTPSITFIVGKTPCRKSLEGTLQHGLTGRVAFIAGKKSGNAVWRNQAKRRMREVCRSLGGPWPGYDVVMLAKPSINGKSHARVLNECSRVGEHALSSLWSK